MEYFSAVDTNDGYGKAAEPHKAPKTTFSTQLNIYRRVNVLNAGKGSKRTKVVT